jgi:hypothetical protein
MTMKTKRLTDKVIGSPMKTGISKQISYRNRFRYLRTCLVAIKANEAGIDVGSKHGYRPLIMSELLWNCFVCPN